MLVVEVVVRARKRAVKHALLALLAPIHTQHAVLHQFRCQRAKVARLQSDAPRQYFRRNRGDAYELVHQHDVSIVVEEPRNNLDKPANLGHLSRRRRRCGRSRLFGRRLRGRHDEASDESAAIGDPCA